MKKQLDCLTRPDVLTLLPGMEALTVEKFLNNPAIETLANQIKEEAKKKGLTEEDIVRLLAQTSLLAFSLLEIATSSTQWPKDITA